ncbi:MAG: TldD/PmbA family protein [Candidatus Odinarchaeota archaeon]
MDDLTDYLLNQPALKNFDFIECRQERAQTIAVNITEDGLKDLVFNEDNGLSVRLLKNGLWFFTFITNPTRTSLENILEKDFFKIEPAYIKRLELYDTKGYVDNVEVKASQTILNVNIDDVADIPLSVYRELNSLRNGEYSFIRSFNILFNSTYKQTIYSNNQGSKIIQSYPFNRLNINLTGLKNGKQGRASETVGGVRGLEAFKDGGKWSSSALLSRSINRVKNILNGSQPPKGIQPVVMDPSMTGTLIHEAFGHLCEADLVMAGGVITPQQIGKKIAHENVTITDEPLNIDGGWVPYDQEGVRGDKSILVEKGILKNFMVNREYAKIFNQPPKGNARAASYRYPPIIRMRNTYLKSGDHSFEEMIEDIETGVYVEKFIGGQASLLGTFQFAAQVGWLIEGGELKNPLRDVSISGSTFETLMSMDAVGKNFETDIGTCGKGQLVIVGDGGPAVRVPRLIVGGV